MSWQDYVDQQLIATGKVEEGFIVGKDDGSVWACTPEFMPRMYPAKIAQEDGTDMEQTVNEASNLVAIMRNPSEYRSATGGQGLRINGEKYMVLRDLEDTLYAGKTSGGACLVVTNQCIICGTWNKEKGMGSGNCNVAVEALGDWLKESGF